MSSNGLVRPALALAGVVAAVIISWLLVAVVALVVWRWLS